MSGPSPATSARASAEIPLCQPPDPAPRKPRLICPPGTADCHVHVYGPADRYPVAATRAFDVPDALPARLRALHDTLGVERLVLVQPSGYGTDNRRHLEAVAELGRPARVIVALRSDVQEKLLGAGLLADASSPQALRSFIASEAARWRPVIAEAGIRID